MKYPVGSRVVSIYDTCTMDGMRCPMIRQPGTVVDHMVADRDQWYAVKCPDCGRDDICWFTEDELRPAESEEGNHEQTAAPLYRR